MDRSGSHQAKRRLSSDSTEAARPSAPTGPTVQPNARIAELEAQLATATQALQSQRSSYDEDSASFEKTLARLAQSERALSQTKARLVHAETLAKTEQARAEALAAEVTSIRETAAAELSLAREKATAAEAREHQALAAARAARFEQAANVAELEELQGKMSELHAQLAELALRHRELSEERARGEVELTETLTLNEQLKSDLEYCQGEVTAAEERNAVLTHERTRLLGLLASLEVLAHEITHLTVQAASTETNLPKVEAWLGRDVEAKHSRATVRPEGASAPALRASRTRSAPEIVVDGIKLES